jgi:hypothetical protein
MVWLRPYWEEALGVKLVVGPLYPEYLNIYADRGAISPYSSAGRPWRGSSSTTGRSAWATRSRRRSHDLY